MNSRNQLSNVQDVLDILEKDYIKRYKRRWRSITDRILLLDISFETKKDNNIDQEIYYKIESKILGSKNKEYTISIVSDHESIGSYLNESSCKCSCPDFTCGKNICKHLYWFSYKFMHDIHPDRWNFYHVSNLINLLRNRSIKIKGRNDMCSICLEEIDYDKENTICCVENCNNSVHQFCWNKYNIFNLYKNTCVICRNYMQLDPLYTP